jgi:hypothetical protein
MIRVCLSVPNFTDALVEKGSRCCVTDSKEIARVESSWLIRTGATDCAEAFGNWIKVAPTKSVATQVASNFWKRECEPETIEDSSNDLRKPAHNVSQS